MIYHFKSLVLVRKGRAFYATLYQEEFFANPGGGGSLSYCEIFSYCQLILLSIILCYLGKSRVETKLLTLTDYALSGPPKYHYFLAPHPAEPHSTDQRSLDLQKSLNINIASYFIDTPEYPHANTWHHRGGPTTQIIDHFFLIIIIGSLWNIHGKY